MGCGGSSPVQDAYESPRPPPGVGAVAWGPARGRTASDESPRGILWASGQYGKERRNSDASVARGGIKFGETPSNGISIIQGVPVMKARLVEASEEMDGPGGPGVMSNGNPRLVKLTLTAIEAAPIAEPAAADDVPPPRRACAAATGAARRPEAAAAGDWLEGPHRQLRRVMGEAVETEAARNSETG